MSNPKYCKGCRYGRWLIAAVLLALLLGSMLPTKWRYPQPSDCSYPIYVSSVNHFHAELIVPVTTAVFDWRSHLALAQLGSPASPYRYLSFGWGDRKFFMNASFDPITIFDTLLLPGPGVMHVWGHRNKPSQLPPAFEIKQLWLSRAEYLTLMAFINGSFQHSPQGSAQYIRRGLYADSGFYEAVGSYSIARTCNIWTAEALKQAGVNTPLWSAFAPAVMQHLSSNCGIAKRYRPQQQFLGAKL
jgi:uncharacterized protein (TIGR02117 family)